MRGFHQLSRSVDPLPNLRIATPALHSLTILDFLYFFAILILLNEDGFTKLTKPHAKKSTAAADGGERWIKADLGNSGKLL